MSASPRALARIGARRRSLALLSLAALGTLFWLEACVIHKESDPSSTPSDTTDRPNAAGAGGGTGGSADSSAAPSDAGAMPGTDPGAPVNGDAGQPATASTFDPNCARCLIGQARCVQGAGVSCVESRPGCTEWQPNPSDRACCRDECSSGDSRCLPNGSQGVRELCGNFDADGCLEWGPGESCPLGCRGTGCNVPCNLDADCQSGCCYSDPPFGSSPGERACALPASCLLADAELGSGCGGPLACQSLNCTTTGSCTRVCASNTDCESSLYAMTCASIDPGAASGICLRRCQFSDDCRDLPGSACRGFTSIEGLSVVACTPTP